ncbi:MAG TPA: nitroreductase family protein [Syntrophorhabdaceae bacterium]|nr:nitroreductase family protein [Syntrophorhabdaceae bacterium]
MPHGLRELILRNRSYRRFCSDRPVTTEQLEELVDLARLSPSAANLQPLKFLLSNTLGKNELIFSCLAWAAYLKDWPGPDQSERPAAYILILGDKEIAKEFWCNHGIAAQSILLGAVEVGLGGCILAAMQREKLRRLLTIPARYEILLAIALGEPKERVVLVDAVDGEIKYWRDAAQTHYVPKRPLSEIILDL